MEAQKVKYPLEKMKYLAEDVVRLLRPYCTRIEIAGSIRRTRSEVSDIEIVCIPKTMMVPTLDLLDPLKEVRMPGFVNAVDA
ncbi:MAG: hypothetical protein ABIA66_02590, partial [Candidatus Omnitrophota bacterium]